MGIAVEQSLDQAHAVKRALDKFDALLLQGHLAACMPEGFRDGHNPAASRRARRYTLVAAAMLGGRLHCHAA